MKKYKLINMIFPSAMYRYHTMFKGACKYVSSLEDIYPLATHVSYVEPWKEACEDMCEFGNNEESVLDAIISFRLDMYNASFHTIIKEPKIPIDSWKWLLTIEQMPQRTTEWYLQKSTLLTASEISAIWKSQKARNALILSKVNPQLITSKRLACLKEETGPMDWGVRYEPIVKEILEKMLQCKIQELGRIYHRTIEGLAASPDGLITEGSSEYIGSLVEIKCPTSRPITDDIPFDYWCQMQIQMEVCDIPRCEYVEVKLDQANEKAHAAPEGWISLFINKESDEMRYEYHSLPEMTTDNAEWLLLETYPWALKQIRRTTVIRDTEWFRMSKDDIPLFWKDVDAVKKGTLHIEPPKKRKVVEPEIPNTPMFQMED